MVKILSSCIIIVNVDTMTTNL